MAAGKETCCDIVRLVSIISMVSMVSMVSMASVFIVEIVLGWSAVALPLGTD